MFVNGGGGNGIKQEEMGNRGAPMLGGGVDIEMEDAETAHFSNNGIPDFKLFESQPLSPIHITTYYNNNNNTTPVSTRNSAGFVAPKPLNERKRKSNASEPGTSGGGGSKTITPTPSTSTATTGPTPISDKSDNSNNKIRRVQNKIRSHYNNNSGNVSKDMMSHSTTTTTTSSNAIAGNKTRGK